MGAARTYKLESNDDVERYLADKPAVDYIVEEFVRGELITYDGLTGRAGEIVFDSTFHYSSGVMEAVNQQLDLSYWIPRAIPSDVQEVRPCHGARFRPPRAAVPLRDLSN